MHGLHFPHRVTLPARLAFSLSAAALLSVVQPVCATPAIGAAPSASVAQPRVSAEPAAGAASAESGAPWAQAPEERWYGAPIAVVDGIALASFAGALAIDSPSVGGVLFPLSMLGYTLGGPIVHWTQGHVGFGFASLGTRVLAPLGGMVVGALVGAPAGSNNGFINSGAVLGALAGFGLGLCGAVAVDLAVYAWESPTDQVGGLRLAPLVLPGTTAPTGQGAQAGLPLRLGIQGAW